MTVTDPYTGIGVITRGAFDSDMAAISLSLHSSCNDIALNEKNSPSFCQIHFYRGIFHLLSSCTLSTLRAFNSSSFHPSSPQIHPFSMIPVTPHRTQGRSQRQYGNSRFTFHPQLQPPGRRRGGGPDRFMIQKMQQIFRKFVHASIARLRAETDALVNNRGQVGFAALQRRNRFPANPFHQFFRS